MTQTSNRFFDEVARLMNDAAGVAGGVRREFDTLFKTQAERVLRELDVVQREDFEAVKEMAPQITAVSAERIRDELIKTFTRPHAGRGLELLDSSGLLAVVLPEMLRQSVVSPAAEPESTRMPARAAVVVAGAATVLF